MKLAKKILFWILYVPVGVSLVVAGILRELCDDYDTFLHKYENWTFYDKWEDDTTKHL